MSTWYYVDTQQNRQGPVSAEDLAGAFRDGRVRADSLVWREGLAQWTPLADCLGELGLAGAAAPDLPPPAPGPAAVAVAVADAGGVVYAGFLRRLIAFLIDNVLLGCAFYAVLIIVVMAGVGLSAMGPGGLEDPDNEAALMVMGLVWLIYPLMSLAYFAGMESSGLQATVGKLALGIKVTDDQGRRLGRGHAAGRWLASLLSYLTLYIGFFMAGFTERKRALHDIVASTLVVDRWAYTDQPERQQRDLHGCLVAVAVAVVAMIAVAVLGILAAIALPAYQDYVGRSKLAGVVLEGRAAQVRVEQFRANTDRCPRDAGEINLPAPATPGLAALEVAEDEDGRCMVALELDGLPGAPQLAGSRIWLVRGEDGEWTCHSDLSQRKFLPPDCR